MSADPFEETTLRAALRLEPGEAPPRVDVAAIVAAHREGGRVAGAVTVGLTLAALAAASLSGLTAAATSSLAVASMAFGLDAAIAAAAGVERLVATLSAFVPAFLVTIVAAALYAGIVQHREVGYATTPRT